MFVSPTTWVKMKLKNYNDRYIAYENLVCKMNRYKLTRDTQMRMGLD
jgi:hypothetical protein